MTAYKGSMVLIKLGNGGEPEVFTTIGGLVDIRMRVNNDIIENSSCETDSWKSFLENAGSRVLTIAARGIFLDSTSEETLRSCAFGNNARHYRLYFGNGDYLQALFQINRYERLAEQRDAEQYAITMQSSGNVVYVAS